MKKTLIIAFLLVGCTNPGAMTRSGACGSLERAFRAARFPGTCSVLCPWWGDDPFQTSCLPHEEGCETPCDPAGVDICEAAVRTAESCDGFQAVISASCGVDVCGG